MPERTRRRQGNCLTCRLAAQAATTATDGLYRYVTVDPITAHNDAVT